MNHILGRGNNQSYPPVKDDNGIYATSSCDKAQLFNDYFLSHCKVDETNARLPPDNDTPTFKLDHITVSEDDVFDIISTLDVNKSTGHDGISIRMLKLAGATICSSLTKLFQLCLSFNKFPDVWKKANVIPLYRKGDKDLCSNYRPVSVLPALSKVLERIVFKNVYNFFLDHKVLSVHQSGFRPNDSTVNQLAFLYHTFCQALDQKKDVRMVFCDVSKAFDRVWHRGLLYKLRRLGITGDLLCFFENYLSNRQQRVLVKGQYSSWGSIEAGVPQGSVLGPLLFLVYINDIVNDISCNIKLFADDTALYVLIDNQQVAADILNNSLQQVDRWSQQWLVNFNPAKTKLMNISLKSSPGFEHHPIYFNDHVLDEVASHKHLGVIFSNDLKWSSHVNSLVQSVSRIGDVMQKLKYRLDRETLQTIYFSLVRPKLEYACVVWDDCSAEQKNLLENTQLLFARIVTGAKRGTSHELLYHESSWATLADRRDTCKLKFMHNIYHRKAPDYLSNVLPVKVDNRYKLRNDNNLAQFETRTEKFRKSIFPDCIRKWNTLPVEVREIDEKKEFIHKVLGGLNDNKLYYGITRRLGVIHAQFRMRCSNLNDHLFSLHVIDSPNCICSNQIENCEHFFFHCRLYHDYRKYFLDNIVESLHRTNITVTTKLLLFGSDRLPYATNMNIFVHVEKYIHDSGRFA